MEDSRYMSRKWLLTVAILVVSSLFLTLDIIDKAIWSNMLVWIAGLYFTGNVAQKFTDTPQEKQ